MARVLAAKTSLAARIDSFTEEAAPSAESGNLFREKVEHRLSVLDGSVGFGMRKKTKEAKIGDGAYNRQEEQEKAAGGAAEPLTFIEGAKDKKDKKRKKADSDEEDEPKAKKAKKGEGQEGQEEEEG